MVVSEPCSSSST